MSKPLILCASALLAALSLATPAAAHHDDASADHVAGGLRPDETERLRMRAEHRIERASRRLEELARTGALTPEQLERATSLRERVARQTQQIFAGGHVTTEQERALRSLKREARAFRRELRESLRGRHRRSG